MLRHTGERHIKWLGKLGDGRLALGKSVDDSSTRRIGQCTENRIEVLYIINHMVKCYQSQRRKSRVSA